MSKFINKISNCSIVQKTLKVFSKVLSAGHADQNISPALTENSVLKLPVVAGK